MLIDIAAQSQYALVFPDAYDICLLQTSRVHSMQQKKYKFIQAVSIKAHFSDRQYYNFRQSRN